MSPLRLRFSTAASTPVMPAADPSSSLPPLPPRADADAPRPLQPIDPQVTTIQPGGGIVMQIELAWGRCRRALLRKLRPGYVRRMKELRQGEPGPIPFEPIDPRDTKYYRNQATYWWPPEADRFAWRDRLPFVRAGLAELLLIGGGFLLLALLGFWYWWPLGLAPAVIALLVIWFFRDPPRTIPQGAGVIVSPADGKVVEIIDIEDPLLGPATRVGIFLTIFNVHANRAAMAGRVIGIEYRPGKFLNALKPESARENECLEVRMEMPEPPYRLIRIRQITGQFARRIVCWVRPGDMLARGEMFGMIKLGSRTELVLPRTPDLEFRVEVGQWVQAGASPIACYTAAEAASAPGASP